MMDLMSKMYLPLKSRKHCWKKVENNIDDVRNLIGQLKADKLDKPSESPTIGKILKVKSVNEDGTFVCEWADEGSLDVQIAGQSIVQDGVANIPRCGNNTEGVCAVKQNGWYGIYYPDKFTGLSLYRTNISAQFPKRNFVQNAPFLLDQVDDVLKRAMCDGKGAAWTEEERTGARARMGLRNGNLIEIVKYTVTEDDYEQASAITVTSEKYPELEKIRGNIYVVIYEDNYTANSGWRHLSINGIDFGDVVPGKAQYIACEYINEEYRISAASTGNTTASYSMNTGVRFVGASNINSSVSDMFYSQQKVPFPITKITLWSHKVEFIHAGATIRIFGEVAENET